MLDTAMRTMLEEAGGEQVDDPGFISSDLFKRHHVLDVDNLVLHRSNKRAPKTHNL